MDFTKGIFEVAMAALGISVITLLIVNANKTVAVTRQAGQSFNQTLQTLTGQGGGGRGMGGMDMPNMGGYY